MRRYAYPTLLAALAAVLVPGSAAPAEASDTNVIRLATISPRNTPFVRDLMRLDKDLRTATNDGVGIRVYPAGVAGDEKDCIRKLRVGQMDAASLTTTGLGQLVRPVAVLDAPGLINNFEQLKAVQSEMLPEWENAFLDNGVKLVAWAAGGQYRFFSNAPISHPDQVKKMRPWLWPESFTMRELWSVIGATGVPLGLPEVYGALQTGMIDMVIGTAVTFTMLQWHLKLDHVSADATGMLTLSIVLSKEKWESLGEKAQQILIEVARNNATKMDAEVVRDDKRAYDMLLKRGYTSVKMTPEGDKRFAEIRNEVRDRLTGRIYPADLLKRVQAIATKHGPSS